MGRDSAVKYLVLQVPHRHERDDQDGGGDDDGCAGRGSDEHCQKKISWNAEFLAPVITQSVKSEVVQVSNGIVSIWKKQTNKKAQKNIAKKKKQTQIYQTNRLPDKQYSK